MKKFLVITVMLIVVSSVVLLTGDKIDQNVISKVTGEVEVCGCAPEGVWVYYFDYMDNKWYRKDDYIDGKGDTTIYSIDSTADYRYLMVDLIKDEDLGIPNTTEIIGIYTKELPSDKQVTTEDGKTIDTVLHLNLSSNFEFKEDGTPLGEVAVATNIESIVNTFCLNNYGIDAVDFYFDSKKLDIIGGVIVDEYRVPTVSEDEVEIK